MVLYSKFTYGSQFSEEKNGLEILFLVPEISNKYKRSIFFETPCSFGRKSPISSVSFYGPQPLKEQIQVSLTPPLSPSPKYDHVICVYFPYFRLKEPVTRDKSFINL